MRPTAVGSAGCHSHDSHDSHDSQDSHDVGFGATLALPRVRRSLRHRMGRVKRV